MKPGLLLSALRIAARTKELLNFLVDRVPLQEPVVLLLLDALGDGLLVPERQVARGRLTLFLGFGAFQGDLFLHDLKGLKGQRKGAGSTGATRILRVKAFSSVHSLGARSYARAEKGVMV